MNPLNSLRDIHLPPPISIWPLPPGWYIAGLFLLILLGYSGFRFYSYWRYIRPKRIAFRALDQLLQKQDQLSTETLLMNLSCLVRRMALAYFPRKEVAGLVGDDWLKFLDDTGQTTIFTCGIGRHLSTAPYQSTPNVQITLLFETVARWIKQCSPRNMPKKKLK